MANTAITEPTPVPLAPHGPLSEFYAAPAGRPQFVNELFDQAAPDYDWLSGLLSFWTDRSYRRQALRRAGLKPGMKLLDVATGTGLVVKAALQLGLPPGDVCGVDPSQGMLAQNRARNPVSLLQGRGEKLPFPDASFDFVTMGYALRHVEDLRRLFSELRRVLRPEGRLLLLEITRPQSRIGFGLMQWFMRRLLPRLVRWLRRNESSARLLEYYWVTIAECVPPAVILAALNAEGWRDVRRVTFGPLLSEYVARK
jgi:demethylmenaquinone methyltransferase/2-methoxy-6-polyprenyl-1,4-benzoquinol methylase